MEETDYSAKISEEYKNRIKFNDYLFEIPKKWARSPELLSLYFMIVKLCQFNLWDDFHKVEDLPKVANKIKSEPRRNNEIIQYFTKTFKFWIPVLDRINELFMSQTAYENFKHYNGYCGFHVFVLNQGGTSYAAKKWNKIRKEMAKNTLQKKLEGKTT